MSQIKETRVPTQCEWRISQRAGQIIKAAVDIIRNAAAGGNIATRTPVLIEMIKRDLELLEQMTQEDAGEGEAEE